MVYDWKGVTAPVWHSFFLFLLQLKLVLDHLFFFLNILHQVPAIIKPGKSVVFCWVPV
jgi:hypothetical protein